MRNPKIDPALRERRAILELLQRVDKPEITYAELEGVAEELVGSGAQAAAVLLQEIAKTEDLDRLNKLTFLAAYLDDERIVEPLSRLLFHPKRSRAYKAQILQALERLGVDTSSRFYRTLFRQREAMQLNLVELRRRMAVRPEAAVQFLYDVFYASQAQRLATAQMLLEDRDGVSLYLVGLLAEISEAPVWKTIVQELSRIRSPDSAAALVAMTHYGVAPKMVAEAGLGIRRLQFLGVTPPERPRSGLGQLHAWASRIEGNGTQMVWLAAGRGGDAADSVCFLLHEVRGLIDCFGEVRTSLKQFEQTSVQAGEEDGGRAVALPYALSQIENALFLTQSQGLPLPPEYPFRIRCLPLQPLQPRLKPAVGGSVAGAPDWKALTALFDDSVLDDWLITEPQFFEQVGRFFERGRFERSDMENFVEQIFGDYISGDVPLLRQRLIQNAAWVEEWGGPQATCDGLRQAAQTLDTPQPSCNPFVQHYLLRSIREAHEMLREGYDPSLVFDDEF